MRQAVPSGNAALYRIKTGHWGSYDRGELLFLIARSITEQDACCEEARIKFGLTDVEVRDVLSMVD